MRAFRFFHHCNKLQRGKKKIDCKTHTSVFINRAKAKSSYIVSARLHFIFLTGFNLKNCLNIKLFICWLKRKKNSEYILAYGCELIECNKNVKSLIKL